MGGVTKSDFEWRFIFEKSALNFEFQTRLFVFPVVPAWRFNLELFCVLVCFCDAIWFRMKVQPWDFLHVGLFLWSLLTPSEGSVWVVLCWMAPSFPPNVREKVEIFDLSWKRLPPNFVLLWKWTLKKNFPLRGPGFGGPEQGPGNARAARAQRAKRAIYLYTFFNLVLTASPKIALCCAFLHTPLERVEL